MKSRPLPAEPFLRNAILEMPRHALLECRGMNSVSKRDWNVGIYILKIISFKMPLTTVLCEINL